MIRSVFTTTSVLLLQIAVAHTQTGGGGRLRAGAHKVDFTPKATELQTSTDSIRDHLYARAIVIDDGSACAVLVGIDLGAAPNPIVDDAIARATKSTGCPAQNFIISATHTHSSNTQGLGQGAPTAKTVADAIVEAATVAKSRLAPARIGYGTTKVDLNVNRDLFNRKLEWRQEPNPDGPSDKTLAVVELLGSDNVPMGVYMNYAMHPINFYLSGVISADFPGEASRYVEELFDNRTVAIFSQGASGDQNPRDFRSPTLIMGQRTALTAGRGPFVQRVGEPPTQDGPSGAGFNPQRASSERTAIPNENLEDYKKALARTGDYVRLLGSVIGSSAVRVMRESMQPTDAARIWGGQETFACPGRVRLDADNPARENVFPGYKDGPDVTLKVGVLRVGDIHFASVNGEVYSDIATRLKAEAPASKTIVVTLANGFANSGYIYSDAAYSHLTFQVIGSRLKPGCAEGRIVSTALDLMRH
jgi:Neutral/alkaline non-lysosomal ceramidase, N-terminal